MHTHSHPPEGKILKRTQVRRGFDLFLSGNRSMDPFGARYLCDFYCSAAWH
ncbi:hypothetical protein [Streptomyces sp. A1277]|uniref:hypothetical protein n=1 Tax=Streptomyces sp. A1277 TaxID=2563103 RepID=UPI0014463627|nr:hypothetical protein [Streptomyces sp. A1277]